MRVANESEEMKETLSPEEVKILREIFALTGGLDVLTSTVGMNPGQMAALPELQRKGFVRATRVAFMVLKMPEN